MKHHTRPTLLLFCAVCLLAVGCASTTNHAQSGAFEVLTVREAYANVHIVKAAGRMVMIDSGLERSAEAMEARMIEEGIDPAQLDAIILTHGHADHAGGAGYFRARYETPIVAGRGDASMVEAGHVDALCPTGALAESLIEEDQAETFTPFEADTWLDADALTDTEPMFGIEGTIVPMPGHTDGSITLIFGDMAFVGDLFRGSIVGGGAETHFYMCDLEDNLRDIEALLTGYPGVTTFYTGHFGSVSREDVEDYVAARQEER